MKNKKLFRTLLFVSFFMLIPRLAFADTASDISTIDGAKELVKFFDIFMRGVGAVVLMIGTAQTFMKFGSERQTDRIKGLKTMCCGFLMVCSYSFICKVCDISSYNSFQLILSVIAFFMEFIGAMCTIYGAYQFAQSLKDQDGESKQRAIKNLFSGLAVIAVAQCSNSFLI